MVLAALLTCFMLPIMWFDLTRYVIPNWLVGILLALYPTLFVFGVPPEDWWHALWVMLLVFIGGVALFHFRVMGGGTSSC